MEWIPLLLMVAAGVILLITSAYIVNICEKEDEEDVNSEERHFARAKRKTAKD